MQEIWQKKLWLIVMAVVWVVLAAGCQAEPPAQVADDLAGLYSIDLPAGDWQPQAANIWAPVREQEVLTDVRIWLVRLVDCQQEAAERQLQEDGYAERSEQPGFWLRQADGQLDQARLVVEEKACWLIYCSWPESDAEWEEPLTESLASFELVQE